MDLPVSCRRKGMQMFFWKKNEDPWDIAPGKRKAAPAAQRQEKKEPTEEKDVEEKAPVCPWCGAEMVRGYLTSGRGGVFLQNEEPDWSAALGAVSGVSLARDGGMLTGLYAPCWQCKHCRKLVAEIPGERGPNYVWKNGKVVLPAEEGETL